MVSCSVCCRSPVRGLLSGASCGPPAGQTKATGTAHPGAHPHQLSAQPVQLAGRGQGRERVAGRGKCLRALPQTPPEHAQTADKTFGDPQWTSTDRKSTTDLRAGEICHTRTHSPPVRGAVVRRGVATTQLEARPGGRLPPLHGGRPLTGARAGRQQQTATRWQEPWEVGGRRRGLYIP